MLKGGKRLTLGVEMLLCLLLSPPPLIGVLCQRCEVGRAARRGAAHAPPARAERGEAIITQPPKQLAQHALCRRMLRIRGFGHVRGCMFRQRVTSKLCYLAHSVTPQIVNKSGPCHLKSCSAAGSGSNCGHQAVSPRCRRRRRGRPSVAAKGCASAAGRACGGNVRSSCPSIVMRNKHPCMQCQANFSGIS